MCKVFCVFGKNVGAEGLRKVCKRILNCVEMMVINHFISREGYSLTKTQRYESGRMANIIYASITGNKQGLISAGCGTHASIGNKYQSSHPDEIFVLQFGHSLSREANVVHCPVRFYKPLDKSSPLLSAAISENEELKVVFNFYRTSISGGIERYYTIELQDVHLSNIATCYPHVLTHAGNQPEEVITMNYKNITWKHLLAGTESYSLWHERIF